MELNKLPVDVASKIASYYLGEPEYIKLKHSKGLRQIQKRYRQIYRGLQSMKSYDNDDNMFYEFYHYKLTTKDKRFKFIDNLRNEVDYIKTIVNESHIRYMQPDMHCKVHILIDCLAKMKDEPDAIDLTFDNRDVFWKWKGFVDDGEFNIQYIIDNLHEKLFDELDTFCYEEYNDLIMKYLSVGVFIMIDPEKFA